MARGSNVEKRAFWQLAIQMQAESGLSVGAFCKREGLKPCSFYRWRRRLQRETNESTVMEAGDAEEAAEPPRLAPVRLLDDDRDAAVEIVASNGLVVRVRGDAATENVRRVVGLVQEMAGGA